MEHLKWFFLFLRTRISWILWIMLLHLIFLGIAYIDYDISVGSIYYIIILNLGLTSLFLVFTYVKEIKFFIHLNDNIEPEELKHKGLADTPFQQKMVEYLYNQITSQKLIVTKQRMKIQSTEASLTDFVHDIKTPVTAMKLMIEKEADMDKKRALLFEWTRINDMLDKQLYLTRIESQNNDMYFEYVPLKRLIIEEIQLTRYLSQAKGIGYELDLDESHHVYTDSKWCRMMIRQIFSNAIKYSENSTIYVKSSLINEQVQVQIKDEGRGISKKDLPRIFDKGFTSTNYRNETTSSGIGLYLVNTVKENLGIQVEVVSDEGHGTEVTFIFPTQNELVKRISE
ncbi:sensor histidine kinase [Staphylococcus gallinarum]|jgi:two-component system sensor histidine kinase GraS|uniref:histidine kinase n=1 Tax=Staphylococcus gallinarum TaxID=1293 RepID=A0A2T4SW53_STAGA|nr:sensor histidine kinase [Staphylococcus gallinarum]PTL08556.1 sensor histidine kinase [Staphylococcus gallinarum]PTL09231.1 sensor histidine kinase [Staphylococcus gallinarum]RIL21544.1 sensor histidine kinase [Staphylococcus gallinarum]RIL25682.1 sensor histidine kinase [Staphylococcus gallinarum]RIL30876.1 sensor histidine kinase [Staphylococcus gallinarum]